MTIAASQSTKAAQAIDRDLFDESLKGHHLPRMGTDKLLWLK
jgi:hypothetical protein